MKWLKAFARSSWFRVRTKGNSELGEKVNLSLFLDAIANGSTPRDVLGDILPGVGPVLLAAVFMFDFGLPWPPESTAEFRRSLGELPSDEQD